MTFGQRVGQLARMQETPKKIVGCDDDCTVRVAKKLEASEGTWAVMSSGSGGNAENIYGKNLWAVAERREAGMRDT